jgi:hypothetical protein
VIFKFLALATLIGSGVEIMGRPSGTTSFGSAALRGTGASAKTNNFSN